MKREEPSNYQLISKSTCISRGQTLTSSAVMPLSSIGEEARGEHLPVIDIAWRHSSVQCSVIYMIVGVTVNDIHYCGYVLTSCTMLTIFILLWYFGLYKVVAFKDISWS